MNDYDEYDDIRAYYGEYEETEEPTKEELLQKLPGVIGFHKDHPEGGFSDCHSWCEFSTYEELVHEIFAMEDACDATAWRRNGESIDVLHALMEKLEEFMTDWKKQRELLENESQTRNNYEHWRVIKRYGR